MFHGLQAHAASDPWKGQNALDAMIALFVSVGAVAPAARRRTPGSTGSSRRAAPPRTSSRTGRKAWFMIRSADQAYYEVDEGALPPAVRGGGARRRLHRRGHLLGRRDDDEAEHDPRGALDRERRGAWHRGPGPGRELGLHGHGQRQLGDAHDPPGPLDHRRGPPPGHSIAFRDAAASPRGRRDRCCSRRRSSPRPRWTS